MASFRQTLSSKVLAPVFSVAAAAAFHAKNLPTEDGRHNNHDKRHHLVDWHPRRLDQHRGVAAACEAAAPGATSPKLNVEAPTLLNALELSTASSNQQQQQHSVGNDSSQDDAAGANKKKSEVPFGSHSTPSEGFQPNAVGMFHGMFPSRQLFRPAVPYPLWYANWDGRQPETTDDPQADKQRMRSIRKNGTTRHIILIRHGQYDETHREDELRKLTPLGREQAHRTGERLAEMMRGADGGFDPCIIRSVRVSAMTRARETAEIIASHLDNVGVAEPNPSFNEGRPCHTIPGGPISEKIIKVTEDNHLRIEGGFRELFVRADEPTDEDTEQHEFEIVVCHANVIRYWMCRALQLPPEAWLRYCPFNCSLTYITIRPTGSVSCRMLGDIGHLPYNMQTFSGHNGYNW